MMTITGMSGRSRIDSNKMYDQRKCVVSIVNTGSKWLGHCIVIVEAIRNQKIFIGVYQIWAKTFEGFLNRKGVIREIEVHEAHEYCYYTTGLFMPLKWGEKHPQSRSWVTPIANALLMIEKIKRSAAKITLARLCRPWNQFPTKFQLAGQHCLSVLGSNRGHNCTTWAEEQLVYIYAGNGSLLFDSSSAMPFSHVGWFPSWQMTKEWLGLSRSSLKGLFIENGDFLCSLCSEVSKRLADQLKENCPSRKKLARYTTIALPEILKALHHNHVLTHLNLSNLQINDPYTVSLLANMVLNNTGICSLDISGNSLGAKGVALLKDSFSRNLGLRILHLENNQLDASAASSLAEFVLNNKRLQRLYLDHNQLGDEGSKKLAEAVAKNGELHLLSLAYNNIGLNGLSALADMLRGKISIKELDVRFNLICKDSIEQLYKAVQINRSLRFLHLFSGEECEALAHFLLSESLKWKGKRDQHQKDSELWVKYDDKMGDVAAQFHEMVKEYSVRVVLKDDVKDRIFRIFVNLTDNRNIMDKN